VIRTFVAFPEFLHSGDRLAEVSWAAWACFTLAEGVAATLEHHADAVILRADSGPGTDRLVGLAPGGLAA
jgi:hypothetical protein